MVPKKNSKYLVNPFPKHIHISNQNLYGTRIPTGTEEAKWHACQPQYGYQYDDQARPPGLAFGSDLVYSYVVKYQQNLRDYYLILMMALGISKNQISTRLG
ncbi:hypothetical protein M8J77_024819 [Diaphorina citri]|nr:hypothetical protein M8J77_024819 [Diaphorina citri]